MNYPIVKRQDLPKSRRLINLNNVVVGKILSIKKHPNADFVRIAIVEVGESKHYQIIFGGPPVAKIGDKVAVALPGTLTDDGKLKKQYFRKEPSEAMICAAVELGFVEEGPDVIMILPKDLPLGKPITRIRNPYQFRTDNL